jgi:glycosyltransferase involved in cell wall biosynthesis
MSTPFTALFVSNDPSIFDESSTSRARMREYANAIGTLHIISRVDKAYGGPIMVDEGNLHLHAVRGPKLLALWRMPSQARAVILNNTIQVVSAQDPFEYGMVALKAVRGTQAKLHIQIHTDFLSPWFVRSKISRSPQTRMSRLNSIRQKLADRVIPHANGIRVVSRRVADSIVARYGSNIPTPSIIPIQVPAALPPKVELPPHSFYNVAMTIGRLEPEKRIEDILVALVRIKPHYPSLGLMVVGEGRERKRLEHWAEVLGLTDSVMFLGNRPDAVGLLQNAQLYIQASAYEGYGRTLLEAALAKVPIVTTDVGIVGEVFRGYEEVLATPPGDPTNLSYHVVGMLEDVSTRQQLVVNAEKRAQEYLAGVDSSPEAIAADLLKTCNV